MAILDRPPQDWTRPAIPVRVRLQVVLNQDGKCKATGARLGHVDNVRFDHRPALWERQFDTIKGDTVPPANDPAFIEALTKAAHDARTFGPGGEKRITSAGSDLHRKAKGARLEAYQGDLDAVDDWKAGRGEKPARTPGKIRSRGFGTKKRPMGKPRRDEPCPQ